MNTEDVETARMAMLIAISKRRDDGFSVGTRTPFARALVYSNAFSGCGKICL